MHKIGRLAWAIGIGLLLGLPGQDVARAQPLAEADVPVPLKAWVPWVLHGQDTYGCTLVGERPHCTWPGDLRLELDDQGGRFQQQVVVDRAATLQLPAGDGAWPQIVRVDGRPQSLEDASGTPQLRLTAGSHRIDGTFLWPSMPEVLRLDPSTANVLLRLNGKEVERPRRDDDGSLWLRGSQTSAEAEPERIDLEVYRRIDDGVPLRVTTQIDLRVGGSPRELDLGRVLLSDTQPTFVRADLPVRLAADGRLVAQVYAGSFSITVSALSVGMPERLARGAAPEAWPQQEVWVWAADESLRQVRVQGAPSIDPARTNLPGAWRDLPAFSVGATTALELETTRRGESEVPPNDLALDRDVWLDLDGKGVTVRDAISGTMRRDYRLALAADELGHVTQASQDQLITEYKGSPGVELRTSRIDLKAEWRMAQRKRYMPAVGWSEDMQRVGMRLHLPPGWSLLAVSGADDAPGTWIDRWDLLALFVVCLAALATAKLVGLPAGLAILALLVLTFHEDEAPRFIWLTLLALFALLRVLPQGGFRRVAGWLWWGTLLVLALLAVEFSVQQVRLAIYPQLAKQGGGFDGFVLGGAAAPEVEALQEEPLEGQHKGEAGAPSPDDMRAAAPAGLEQDEDDAKPQRKRAGALVDVLGGLGSGGSYGRGVNERKDLNAWTDPNAVMQTGPGLPDWSWEQWRISWNGPVQRDHQIGLWLASPAVNRALGLLRVLLLAGVLLMFFRRRPRTPRPPDRGPGASDPKVPGESAEGQASTVAASGAALLLGLVLCFGGALVPTAAQAQAAVPPEAVLNELRSRLVAAPACGSKCVAAPSLSLRVVGERLVIEGEVHAAARAAYPLPGPAKSWLPSQISVDGRPSSATALLDGAFVFLRLEPGPHRVRLEGSLTQIEALTLAFGSVVPHQVRVSAPGWNVEGVRDDGRVNRSVQLRRLIKRAASGSEEQQEELASWFEVRRELTIGVRWTVQSSARRLTEGRAPAVLRIPLLEGESVAASNVAVENGRAVVSLGRDQAEVQWSSSLEPRKAMTLRAHGSDSGNDWSETWLLKCSPIWRCKTEGLTPVREMQGERWEPEFKPWPGESLKVLFARPKAFKGRSTTVDRVELVVTPGKRMLRAELETSVRTSTGGEHAWTLPKGVKVQALRVDGQERQLNLDGQRAVVTLRPGSQRVQMTWQQKQSLRERFEVPAVSVGAEAVNARVRVVVPSDRWLLWVGGPSWGPAILFWGYVLLLVALALVLARTRRTPLGFVEWVLLGLGLAQLPIGAAAVVAGWFFLLDHRARSVDLRPFWFDLRQLFLVGFTLAALGCLYAAVHAGLLIQPDMQVSGGGSSGNQLVWYVDRVDGTLPRPWIFSLPMWTYRILMLVWSMWLAWRLVAWLRWAWWCLGEGGLWKRSPSKPRPQKKLNVVIESKPPTQGGAGSE